ncbi:YcsE-related riboflavin metabolism phosphatase [Mycoplasma phocoenae]|uniref:HAD family phosphatase n=1 Tax=Mycoplasma phocoenae TaxID=754517 RepID=A0A858U217_9MOLU|nr:HAD family hydrolase [Mycoplasma phocoenae]QJG67184.1 HAD family phosphatase [Mycoplasma phocoenae]
MPDKKYKLVAFDIDGTILPFEDGQKNQPLKPEIVEMFAKLKQQGYITAFCTGRDIFTIGDKINTPNVDYLIGANGGFIMDLTTREYIFEKSIPYEDFKVFQTATEKLQLPYQFIGKKQGYYNKLFDINHWFTEPFKADFVDVSEYDNNKDDPNYLITVNSEENKEIGAFYKELFKNNNLDMWVLAVWTGGVFIAAKDVHKAKGLEILCNMKGINLRDVVAFGDSSNDVEMLSQVGLGVAMGNASDELKSKAKAVAKPVTEQGAYKFLLEEGIII